MKNAALLFLILLLPALPAFGQQTNVPGDATQGESMVRRWCAACHLISGQGKASDTAPPFHSIAHNPRKTDDYLRNFLSAPHAPMPPLQLTRNEIADIIAYFDQIRAR